MMKRKFKSWISEPISKSEQLMGRNRSEYMKQHRNMKIEKLRRWGDDGKSAENRRVGKIMSSKISCDL